MTIEEFDATYTSFNRISPLRASSTRKTLQKFEAFVGRPIVTATDQDLQAWVVELVAQGYSAGSVRLYNAQVKVYFGWAWRNGHVSADTLMRVRGVKNPRGATGMPVPRPYKQSEVLAFWRDLDEAWPPGREITVERFRRGLAKVSRVYTHSMNLQLRAIATLALDCGLRPSEIYNSKVDEIHPDNAYIVVHGKADSASGQPKIREVPHTQHSRMVIAEWLELRHFFKPEHDAPWLVLWSHACTNNFGVSSPRAPMNKLRYWQLFSRIGDDGYKLHRFRHTCATMWLRAGMPLEKVSQLLGHSNIAMTLGYTKLVPSDIQGAVEDSEIRFNRLMGRGPATPRVPGDDVAA